MANISGYIDTIKSGIYGRDIRKAIYQALDALNQQGTEAYLTSSGETTETTGTPYQIYQFISDIHSDAIREAITWTIKNGWINGTGNYNQNGTATPLPVSGVVQHDVTASWNTSWDTSGEAQPTHEAGTAAPTADMVISASMSVTYADSTTADYPLYVFTDTGANYYHLVSGNTGSNGRQEAYATIFPTGSIYLFDVNAGSRGYSVPYFTNSNGSSATTYTLTIRTLYDLEIGLGKDVVRLLYVIRRVGLLDVDAETQEVYTTYQYVTDIHSSGVRSAIIWLIDNGFLNGTGYYKSSGERVYNSGGSVTLQKTFNWESTMSAPSGGPPLLSVGNNGPLADMITSAKIAITYADETVTTYPLHVFSNTGGGYYNLVSGHTTSGYRSFTDGRQEIYAAIVPGGSVSIMDVACESSAAPYPAPYFTNADNSPAVSYTITITEVKDLEINLGKDTTRLLYIMRQMGLMDITTTLTANENSTFTVYRTYADACYTADGSERYLKGAIDKLIYNEVLLGSGGSGTGLILNLTKESFRLLYLLDRAGSFGNLEEVPSGWVVGDATNGGARTGSSVTMASADNMTF